MVIPRGNVPHVGTKGVLPDDVDPSGVYSGSPLGSLRKGTTWHCKHLVLFCHTPKNTSFP